MNKITLGLLEFGYYRKGVNSLSIVQHIMDYVVKADELGYSRFWLTEHHNYHPTSPWSTPEILLPIFLGISDRIKIGTAGILINYHSPYRVALDHKLLCNLYPGRVDLGFANGTPPENVSRLLRQSNFRKRPDDYYKNIRTIHDFYYNEDGVAVKENIIIPPLAGNVPDMFALTSFFSDENIEKAVSLRLNVSKSLFHDTKSLSYEYEKINRYRESFYKKYNYLPHVNIAVPVICAKTKKQAMRIAEESGAPLIVNTLMGSANYIQDTLHTYQRRFEVDEFILYDKSYEQSLKIETLQKLAEKFNLLN
jgi:luciferase family oxidoreductase group 1